LNLGEFGHRPAAQSWSDNDRETRRERTLNLLDVDRQRPKKDPSVGQQRKASVYDSARSWLRRRTKQAKIRVYLWQSSRSTRRAPRRLRASHHEFDDWIGDDVRARHAGGAGPGSAATRSSITDNRPCILGEHLAEDSGVERRERARRGIGHDQIQGCELLEMDEWHCA
jgi:hypothetical protein